MSRNGSNEAKTLTASHFVVCGFVLFFLFVAITGSGAGRATNNVSPQTNESARLPSSPSVADNYERLMRKHNVQRKDYTNSHGINVKSEHEKMLKMLREAERRL